MPLTRRSFIRSIATLAIAANAGLGFRVWEELDEVVGLDQLLFRTELLGTWRNPNTKVSTGDPVESVSFVQSFCDATSHDGERCAWFVHDDQTPHSFDVSWLIESPKRVGAVRRELSTI